MHVEGSEGNDRHLATILFTDMVGSTELAARLGDRAWCALLDHYDVAGREHVTAYGGRHIKRTGDGLVAVFGSPGRAVACALELVAATKDRLAVEVRAGLHTGECEVRADDVGGIAVHVAARITDLAAPSQVLVSRTVRDLTSGDDLELSAAGTHSLKGVPGRWQVYSARQPVGQSPRPQGAAPADGITTVVLVDDHPLWRQTLRAVVEADGAARVVGETADGGEAVDLVRQARPAVVLLDMQLPTRHGVDVTAELTASGLASRVLVLSSSDDPDTVLDAVRAGASGYLLKSVDAAQIRAAVQRVAAGELVFPPELAAVVLNELRHPPAADDGAAGRLTAREAAVLDLMAEGLSNAAIGRRLYLSGKTVETHVGSILSKLGIEPTDDVNRRVRAVVEHLSARKHRTGPLKT